MDVLHNKKALYIILIIGLAVFIVSYNLFPQFISIVSGLFLSIVGCWLYTIIDDLVLSGLDTKAELAEKNIAYAIYSFGFALLIATGIYSGFNAFISLSIK